MQICLTWWGGRVDRGYKTPWAVILEEPWNQPEQCAQLGDPCCQNMGENHKSHMCSEGARLGAVQLQSCLYQAQGTGQNRLGKPLSPSAAVQSLKGQMLPAVTSRRGLWVAFIDSATDLGPYLLDRIVLPLHPDHLQEREVSLTPSAPR